MKKFLFFLFSMLFVVHADVLTLQESIKMALKNYPDVKSFKLKVKESKLSYKTAFADYLPEINFNAQYNAVQTYVLPQNGIFHTVDEKGWSAGLNLKQKIWDFSKTSSNISAARVGKEISKLSLQELKALLVFRVKGLYELMVLNRALIKVRKGDLDLKSAYYSQAKALLEQGLKTEADASRFLSSLYLAKDNLAAAKASYEKVKNTLSLYMNRKIADDVILEESVLRKDYSFSDDIVDEIVKKNYTLQIEKKNIEKNRFLHQSAKASHFGSFDFVASYNHLDTLNIYDTKAIGVVLNIPLYSGGRVSAEAEKTKVITEIAKEQRSLRELLLKDEVGKLLCDIKRYGKTIEAKKAQLSSAEDTKKLIDARYRVGLATYIEVLDAVSSVLSAELELLETYYYKTVSIDRIDYLKGKYNE